MATLVYFSSTSENTHRFIERLGVSAIRIPIHQPEQLRVDEPYVLVVPTYGGGTHIAHSSQGKSGHDKSGHVPRQVVKFLNNHHNRSLLRGVIAAGNTNFGDSYCYAGDIISTKCRVPYLYRFELMGTADDIERVQAGLDTFWEQEREPWQHRQSPTALSSSA